MSTAAYNTEAQIAQAQAQAHRLDTLMLQTRIERLTAVIREHGLPLPGEDERLGASDGDHLAACRQVVSSAYQLLEHAATLEQALTDLRRMVGSGMELVGHHDWQQEGQPTDAVL